LLGGLCDIEDIIDDLEHEADGLGVVCDGVELLGGGVCGDGTHLAGGDDEGACFVVVYEF